MLNANLVSPALGAAIRSVGVWRTIRALWPKLEVNMLVKVGDDRTINFGGMLGMNRLL